MAKLNAVIVDPDGTAWKTQIENTLGAFQAVVGGYIEGVFGENCTIYVNEEGILQSLPYNPSATVFASRFCGAGQPLFGTALIVGPGDSEGNDTDVHESVVTYYRVRGSLYTLES